MNKRLIYAEDAIDAVANGLKRVFVEYQDVAEKLLNNVPSAPEQRLIPCEKCWHGCPFPIHTERRQDADSSGNMSGTQKELKHTETHSCDCERTETHGWIPVTEALPEDGVTVWVTIKGYDVISCEDGETLEQAIARISKIRWVTQGYWSEEEHGWNDPSFGCPLIVQPIAWMPIDTLEPWKGRRS